MPISEFMFGPSLGFAAIAGTRCALRTAVPLLSIFADGRRDRHNIDVRLDAPQIFGVLHGSSHPRLHRFWVKVPNIRSETGITLVRARACGGPAKRRPPWRGSNVNGAARIAWPRSPALFLWVRRPMSPKPLAVPTGGHTIRWPEGERS